MSKFSVGERVCFYQDHSRRLGVVVELIKTAPSIDRWDLIRVKAENGYTYNLHVKQCRKLKPKPKRRTFWINVYGYMSSAHPTKEEADAYSRPDRLECIEAVGVIKKK